MTDKTTTAGATDENTAGQISGLTPDDEREMELFLSNSGKYCEKVYGGKTFGDEEIFELRKEIKESNEAIRKIRKDWEQS
ncbi:MAG TPA: hypothetical protein VGO50_03815 [Pyrinomonadaceae bacterium]|nr:hypothetical protein [Pyrinomonadaceae bacterium]